MIELLDRAQEADVALLHQVGLAEAHAEVALDDDGDEPLVGLHEAAFGVAQPTLGQAHALLELARQLRGLQLGGIEPELIVVDVGIRHECRRTQRSEQAHHGQLAEWRVREQEPQRVTRRALARPRQRVMKTRGLVAEGLECVGGWRGVDTAQVEHVGEGVLPPAHLAAQLGELIDDGRGLERQSEQILPELGDLLHQLSLSAAREPRVVGQRRQRHVGAERHRPSGPVAHGGRGVVRGRTPRRKVALLAGRWRGAPGTHSGHGNCGHGTSVTTHER
jgi:hypothetical protein